MKYVSIFLIVLSVSILGYWLFSDPTRHFAASVPGADAGSGTAVSADSVQIGAFFKRFESESATLKDVWNGFRGSERDNIKKQSVPLKSQFNGVAPKTMWSVELGEGHSGAAIYAGLVYVLDYDEQLKADMLRCFSLTSGKEQWRRWYSVHVKRNHGMSRTVPAVTEKYILSMGPMGHVMCLDRVTGDFLWGMDIAKKYGSEIPLWYTGQCPLIVDGVAVLATGGNALLIGVECATGKVLWETPNPDGWKMSHSSVTPYEFNGMKMLVYSAVGGVVGVGSSGKILWKTNAWNKSVVAPSPIGMPNGKIFLSAGYGAGSMVLQLKQQGDLFNVEIFKSFKPGDGLSSEQQTPILLDGHLYGILPKDAKTLRNQMVCVSADDPTKVVWSSGSDIKFGLGPYILADDRFYILNDDATLYVVQKSEKAFKLIDKVSLFAGVDAWAPLAVADGFMLLRDSKKMICIDLKK